MSDSKSGGIRLGLCCIVNGIKYTTNRTCRLSSIETKGIGYLIGKARENVRDLMGVLEWCNRNNVKVYRMSSDILPFMGHKEVREKYPEYNVELFGEGLKKAGEYARSVGMRLTFHPGQYNVIGTPNPVILENTIRELQYHADVLDIMEMPADSVMVVHGGGVYGDKESTKRRWVKQYGELSESIKRRLVLENCEKSYSIEDVLEMSYETGVPVVFDIHHYECYKIYNPEDTMCYSNAKYYAMDAIRTWPEGVRPKMHISSQEVGKSVGAHADYIESIPEWLLSMDVDLMVEAKAKEAAIFRLREMYGLEY